MQTTDLTYQTIISGPYKVEYKAVIAGETYYNGDMRIALPEISSSLFEKFGIGNAVAASLRITLVPKGVIPTMAEIDLYYRVTNGVNDSSWKSKGVYFIDTRKADKNGVMTFEAYDSMLKAEYVFMESGSWTSTTALAVVNMVASDIGVTVEANTTAVLTNDPIQVPNVPVIGEDGTTGREMLCGIAAMYGGNFIIDEAGALKLVQLVAPINTATVGKLAENIDIADAFDAIDRVIIKLDEKTGFRSPDVPDATWDAMTGRILEAKCPWTSQAVADFVLSVVGNFVYQPYEALGITIDPAYQLGDGVTINGTTSLIYKQTLKLDPRCAANLTAPFDKEVNHEYPYRSPAQRMAEEGVTKEDLATAGRTTINGSNIHSGVITLGGAGNGEGQVVLIDENDQLYARWDKDRIIIYDETTGLTYESAKFKVVRQGDDPDSEYGVFIGTGQLWEQFFPGTYPNECTPYVIIKGTKDYTTSTDKSGDVMIYPNNVSIGDGNGGNVSIQALPSKSTNAVTKDSGNNIGSQVLSVWGRVVMLTLTINSGTSVGAYSNYFVGHLSDHFPVSTAIAFSNWYEHPVVASIDTSGVIKVTDAGGYSSAFNSGSITVSFVYLY